MPITKSAWKQLRKSRAARLRNQAVRTRIKRVRRAFLEAVAARDPQRAQQLYREYCSVLDKAAKKGVIKKNTSIRRKTRAAARLRTLAA